MSDIDFTTASAEQIGAALAQRLRSIRLARNMTQSDLAKQAGVSTNTIGRLEQDLSVSVDTFIRTLVALRLQQNLEDLVPETVVRPIDRVSNQPPERQRARPKKDTRPAKWTWGDEHDS